MSKRGGRKSALSFSQQLSREIAMATAALYKEELEKERKAKEADAASKKGRKKRKKKEKERAEKAERRRKAEEAGEEFDELDESVQEAPHGACEAVRCTDAAAKRLRVQRGLPAFSPHQTGADCRFRSVLARASSLMKLVPNARAGAQVKGEEEQGGAAA